MAKPFKVTGPMTSAVGIGRMPDGRFTNVPTPTAGALEKQAEAQNKTVPQVIASTPRQDGEDPIPWPAAGPVNDAARPPMKLR
jgi:hypothetical protein